MARRALAITVAVALVVAPASGCGQAGQVPVEAAHSVHIDVSTPPGVRAKQTLDMLNSDWPIGTLGVAFLATHDKVDDIAFTMDRMWWDRPFTATGVDIGAERATLHLKTSYGVRQDVELRTDDTGLVSRLDVTLQEPVIESWADVDAELTGSGARYSYQASRVTDGRCTTVAGTNVDESLPLASIFKLYVLLAVADAVNAGTLDWNDQLTVTAESKQVNLGGFGGLDKLPTGSKASVRAAAQQMISVSDNVATDLLMERMGPGAVERALTQAGHHDPASMTPFPSTHELFSVGWGMPDLREQWKTASPTGRARLMEQTKSHYQPDPTRTHTPASPYGVEWYGTATDICRVHAALQSVAVGPAAPIKDILSTSSGIDLDESKWGYVGAKGGNLPGDLTFSWYAIDRTGQPWVVSFQLTWPIFRSQAAAAWVLSIARQSFALL